MVCGEHDRVRWGPEVGTIARYSDLAILGFKGSERLYCWALSALLGSIDGPPKQHKQRDRTSILVF